ncbi:VWA domain-containing protein [Candidatus Woesearchaeota archaeon]|nr:VWA domain-containing protein [Candidatus Woesearchaeota archaeon]
MTFIMPDFSRVFCMSKYCTRYSYVLFLIIPVVLILFWLIRRNFIKFMSKAEQIQFDNDRKRLRIIMLITRSLIFVFVIMSIASPFILESRLITGNPRLTILTDESNSFDLFEDSIGEGLYEKIKGKIPVDLRSIGSEEESAIGNGILNNLEGGENMLVISDGNNNKGKLLGDIILFSSSINSTISTLNLKPKANDVGVIVEGPYEVIKDTEGSFMVRINNVGEELSYVLEILLDNEIVYSKEVRGSVNVPFTKFFSEGVFHRITAKIVDIKGNDYFNQNNIYYKTIKIVNRPSVLFVTKKSSPLENEFNKLYDVTTTSTIPPELTNYMTVVLNDVPANEILPRIDLLEDYVADIGNGLVVIGGQNSYDRGGYKEANLIESLLPIRVGSGEESEKSDVQVIVVVDVSGSTTEVYGSGGRIEVRDYDQVIKALAADVLNSLDDKLNAGVVVVGTPKSPFVGVVSNIITLKDNKKGLIDKIARLQGGGQSAIEAGIKQATNMLMGVSGGRNIILISDGRGLFRDPMLNAEDAVRQASARAIKTYVVGVGTKEKQETEFLSNMAAIGQGVYFPANSQNRLRILFGEPDEEDEEFFNQLAVLDTVHFITRDIELDVVISGYNYVIPKPAARLLVTTNKNIPILAVWRFGLGRVVSIATDDGGRWAGEILTKQNSKLITRSVNWAIGNLGRKKEFDVTIRDTTLGESTYVDVISKDLPKQEGLFFAKTDVNYYRAEFEPEATGFYTFLGADVAVNYKEEYSDLGIDEKFINLINSTGGTVFEKDDLDGIIDFVIEKSRRIKIESTNYTWPFVLIALVIFLIEIFIRRLWENKIIR